MLTSTSVHCAVHTVDVCQRADAPNDLAGNHRSSHIVGSSVLRVAHNCRVISDGDEGGNSSASGLRGMHRRIKRLFGKTDGEEEVQAADDCDVEQESESEESEGEDEAGEEQLLYWEVRGAVIPLTISHARSDHTFSRGTVCPTGKALREVWLQLRMAKTE